MKNEPICLFLKLTDRVKNNKIVQDIMAYYSKTTQKVNLITYKDVPIDFGKNICHHALRQKSTLENVEYIKNMVSNIESQDNRGETLLFIDLDEPCVPHNDNFGTYGGLPYLYLTLLNIDITIIFISDYTDIDILKSETNFLTYMGVSKIIVINDESVLENSYPSIETTDIKIFSKENIADESFYNCLSEFINSIDMAEINKSKVEESVFLQNDSHTE